MSVSLFIGIANAQNSSELNELLDRLSENHMGSITDVFTSEEIQLLRQHFNANSDPGTTVAPESVGVVMYAPENVGLDLGGYLNDAPGTFNIYGASGTADFEGAGAYNPLMDMYFVVDNAGNAYDVHPTNYSYLLRGMVIPPAGESFVGLEFDPTTNELYGLSTDGAGNTGLSTIDPITLDVSYKGNTGLTLGISLGFDLSGNAYAIDIDEDNAYRLDKSNGNATLLGSIGYDANFGQGFGLVRSTGNLYLSAFNNSIFNSELRDFNTTTGLTMSWGRIGDVSPGGTLQLGWTSAREIDLGIGDQALENLQFFPNPAQDIVEIRADSNIDLVSVYNLLGQLVYERNMQTNHGILHISELSAGSYLMKVTIGNKTSTYKLLKE